jgi:putative ABC transport system permease protein
MQSVLRDVRIALRRLSATPVFTTAATLTMALVIGATASVFALVDGVLLKQFAIRSPDRVVVVWESSPTLPQFAAAPANYLDWRSQNTAFTDLAATHFQQFTVTGTQESERVGGLAVTPSFFGVIGVSPVLGRVLAPDSGGPAEVVLSYGYWQHRFGGATTALGQTLTLNDRPYTIVGVLPQDVPGASDLWTRLSFTGTDQTERESHYLVVVGRLKSGVTLDFAQHDLATVARRLAQEFPKTNERWSVRLAPVMDQIVGPVKPALVMLLAAASCVLLIGAANIANLFLVRCVARQGEMAVRTALGATQGRLVGELLAEATTLGLVAGLLGIGVAVGGVHALRGLAPPTVPRLSQVTVDGRVVAFCALATMATVIVFGVLPAWRTSRGNLAGFLKDGVRSTGSATHRRLQDTLVVLQVAVAIVLLTGAGLLVESFQHVRQLDLGFRPEGVLTAELALPAARYPTPARQAAFVADVVDRLAAQPGVDAVSVSSNVPGAGAAFWGFSIVGDPAPSPGQRPVADIIAVNPGYFRTMGINLRRGRDVRATDDARAAKVAVVDELLARRFGARDAVGERLVGGADTLQIVGVVATVKQAGLIADDRPAIYVPFAQYPDNFAVIALRASGDPAAHEKTIKQVVATLDRTVPVSNVGTMSDRMLRSVGATRFAGFLASLFAVVAFILGVIGIYSVLAYVVSQRQRDIAVRIALGAGRSRVMAVVLWRAFALTTVGLAVGTGAAWIVTRILASLFIGVSPHDPVVFVSAASIFAVVSLLAASVPAFRAARVNPVVALAGN